MAFLTAGESVDRMATYCRIEQLQFGLLGGWVTDLAEPTAKLVMLSTADHCAWRAQRWFEMLPTAPPGPDALLTGTLSELEVFSRLATAVGTSQGARLVVAYRMLLPTLLGALIAHLESTTAVADAPVRRILGIAITDLENDLSAANGPTDLVLARPEERLWAEQSEAQLVAATSGIEQLLQF
ncbi:MAG: hypothetical protein WCJ88_02475 [Actinomycetes bacterium]